MRIFLALLIFIMPVQAWAEETSYFDLDIPVMNGAENIKRERNETFFTVSVEYDLKIEDIDDVYDFYDAFFKEQGWDLEYNRKNSGRPVHFGARWTSHHYYVDQQGNVIFAYSSTWGKYNPPLNVVVYVDLENYENNYYGAKTHIIIKPDLFPKNSNRILHSMELSNNPKEMYDLVKVLGANTFEYKTLDLPEISEEKAKTPIVKRYLYALAQDKCNFSEFGAQFVHKTKPVDGRFIDPTIGDSEKLEEKMKEYQATGEDDPLEEWRAIQEKRIEWEKNKYKGCEQEK